MALPVRNALALGVFEITTQVDCRMTTLNEQDNGRRRWLLLSSGEILPIMVVAKVVSCRGIPCTLQWQQRLLGPRDVEWTWSWDWNWTRQRELEGLLQNNVGNPCLVP